MEEAVYFEMGKADSRKKYIVKPAYLYHVLFRIPKGVKTRLEKIQRDFLWGEGTMGKKIHLVSWDLVCYAKEKGGLGIHGLSIVNRALLGRWVWKFAEEENSIWKDGINLNNHKEEDD